MTSKMGLTYPEMSAQPTFKRQVERPWQLAIWRYVKRSDLGSPHHKPRGCVNWPLQVGSKQIQSYLQAKDIFPHLHVFISFVVFKRMCPACLAVETTTILWMVSSHSMQLSTTGIRLWREEVGGGGFSDSHKAHQQREVNSPLKQ